MFIRIRKIIILILVFLIFFSFLDLSLTFVYKKISYYFFSKQNYMTHHDVYHHELKKNYTGRGYNNEKIFTNKYGFIELPNKKLKSLKDYKNYIIIGDSFAQGVGVELCKKYIDKIVKLMKQVNINSDLTIVIYPWPGQIFRDDKNALQRDIWKNWTQKNNVNFLDLSDLFFNDESTEKERIEIIDRYFLKKDVHLSTNGHNLVSKEFLKKFDKN